MAKEASSPQPDLIEDPGLAMTQLSLKEEEGSLSIARNNDNFVFVSGQIIESGSSSLSSSTDFLNVKHTGCPDDPGERSLPTDFNTSTTPIRIDGSARISSHVPLAGTANELTVTATSTPKKLTGGSQSSSVSGADADAGTLDRDWKIRYRQFLACMLSEPVLIDYFEKSFGMTEALI